MSKEHIEKKEEVRISLKYNGVELNASGTAEFVEQSMNDFIYYLRTTKQGNELATIDWSE